MTEEGEDEDAFFFFFFFFFSTRQRLTNSVRDEKRFANHTILFVNIARLFFYESIDRQIRIALNRDKYPIRAEMKLGENLVNNLGRVCHLV